MKDYQLDPEEQELLDEIERGEWESVKNFAQRKKELMEAARYTSKKTKNINLRVTEKTLNKLKAKAIEEGMPYQTLAASILHKAVSR